MGWVGVNRGTVIKRKKEDNSNWGMLGKQEAGRGISSRDGQPVVKRGSSRDSRGTARKQRSSRTSNRDSSTAEKAQKRKQ